MESRGGIPDMESWGRLIADAFGEMKQRLQSAYKLEDDGSGPPNRVAIRKLIDALPCPVKVLELRVDRSKHPHLHDDVCPLMIFDLSKLGDLQVEWLGNVEAYDSDTLRKILIEQHGIQAAEEVIRSLQHDAKLMGLWELEGDPLSLLFLFYDPRTDSKQFVWDLEMHLEQSLKHILPPPTPPVDYSSLYELKPEPVIPMEKLLEPDPALRAWLTQDWGEPESRPYTIEKLQQRASKVLLIPRVPEHVVRVFNRAKNLYIFAYFKYEFFTVAQHQACLALESAIKHRYCQSLGETVVLRTQANKEIELHTPDYERVWRHWLEEGRKLWVNGRPFPHSMGRLLNWLVEHRVITHWDRKSVYYHLEMRNHLSHPTFASIFPPSQAFATLSEVVSLINKMFHDN
jgi:hypothetical protein